MERAKARNAQAAPQRRLVETKMRRFVRLACGVGLTADIASHPRAPGAESRLPPTSLERCSTSRSAFELRSESQQSNQQTRPAVSHGVPDDQLDARPDEPEHDDMRRTETSCKDIEPTGSQEVRGFESLRLHAKVLVKCHFWPSADSSRANRKANKELPEDCRPGLSTVAHPANAGARVSEVAPIASRSSPGHLRFPLSRNRARGSAAARANL